MCMLFLYVNNDCEDGQFSVIVANNRDEHFERRTNPAHFWSNSKDCVGGLDAHHGREGGTWLGMSARRGIASLLNILNPAGPMFTKKGRGFLVKDFLTGEEKVEDYLSGISAEGDAYGGFHLVCVDYSSGEWQVHHYSNGDEGGAPKRLPEGISVFTNCRCLDKQWAKANYGKPIFTDIVAQLNCVEQRDQLRDHLLALLSDNTQTLPDRVLEEQAGNLPSEIVAERSAISVDSPSINYGTRTKSIVLVDKAGNCEFYERTLREPIDKDDPKWDETVFRFKMQD